VLKSTDIRPCGTQLYFLPVRTRVPLKFGTETLTEVTCARVALRVEDRQGRSAVGWGETPLNVQWVWPSAMPYAARHAALREFCVRLARAWAAFDGTGHPMEVGHDFIEGQLPQLLAAFNAERGGEPMPRLAALVCCSLFDLACHDAYGLLHGVPTYATYTGDWMSRDLADYLEPATDSAVSFHGLYPGDFLVQPRPDSLPAWHLVGGMDWLEPEEDDGSVPDDGYPVLLRDWIRADGLTSLKVKLRGNDAAWDLERMVKVGNIALACGVEALSADFNCTVRDPAYVNGILDTLAREHAAIHARLLYVEQPFPYELEEHPIDVRSVSGRKPLFMDESAHDWRVVRRGRELGWNGVALKTCKTQTGALLSLCWARAHGMALMVQDLTNPMLAQISHVQLAAHGGTIRGVETNGMQFYPEASLPEARVHPGIYQRRQGCVDLGSIGGSGLGYRQATTARILPSPALQAG
jgi:L-alanine-DL-glutamate epimerase-like enolase superfamily enzyme